MAKVGLLTFCDGRDFVVADVGDFCRRVEDEVAGRLAAAGHAVVRAREIVWTNELATGEARRVAAERPDLTIFNIPVWAFPHFTMLAAAATPGPMMLFSNMDPQFPGMVGMLAAAGGLDQVGRLYARAWGDIGEAAVSVRMGRRDPASTITLPRQAYTPFARFSTPEARR